VGMKSSGVYETPGGSILYRAHQVLVTICLDRETQHYKQQVALKYAELIYFGQWYTPLREAITAFVDKTQETVTGEVRLKLFKGNIINAGVTSPSSLFNQDFSTFDKDEVYNQQDADGFIRLFGLPITVRAIMEEKHTRGKDTVVIGKRD
ncbi:MAG: argininosuccinate synthase, partial [Firmicutes bacterium]|nr:argininosuccinate synthase [Bacillota bacterium]